MDNPSTFKFTKILSTNPSQKRITMLGTVLNQQQQGEAIMILNAKMPTPQHLTFLKANTIFKNDIYTRFDVTMQGQYQIQSIYPVTEKHKSKYQEKKMLAAKETAEEYRKGEAVLLEKQLGHLGWADNIITGKAEAERVLVRTDQFVILPDFKFSNIQETENLHLLAIFTDKNLHSIRDLRGKHVPMLKQCQAQITKILNNKFNLQQGSCRIFFHYPPTFYQLHAHVTILKSQAANALTERAHLLQNVINNLEIDGNYYEKVTLIKTIQVEKKENKKQN